MKRLTILFAFAAMAIPNAMPRSGFADSACEDLSVAGSGVANPVKSEDAPITIVCNAEFATVSDDSAVITWVTNRKSPSVVAWWALDGDASGEASNADLSDSLVHSVEITGLAPGNTYYYVIQNPGGVPGLPTQQSPGIFRTFDSTKLGTFLFRFASLNDTHVGEGISGQLTNQAGQPIPPSFSTPGCDETSPDGSCYWAIMNRGAVEGINARDVAFTIVKGDVSSEGGNPSVDPNGAELDLARNLLDRLTSPARPIRGNHDKSLPLFLQKVFDPRTQSGFLWNDKSATGDPHLDFAFDVEASGHSFRFLALDTWDNNMPVPPGVPPTSPLPPPPAIGAGRFTQDQLDWLDQRLSEAESAMPPKKTFLYMHHPTSEIATATAVPPIFFTVRQPDAVEFLDVVRRHSSVVGVLSGHTHRNWITGSALAPGVPFVETASAKEYPGGYGIYEVFENGYIQSFYKCSTEACLEWSEKTRGEYLNLYPLYSSQTGARNGSFAYDFRTREMITAEFQ